MNDKIVMFWLPGQPPRKSNSRRVVRHRGRTKVIKSPAALAWEAQALAAIAALDPGLRELALGSAEHPIWIDFTVYYASRRPDLSVELILDTLQRAGVISDDRHVYEYHAHKHFSRDAPGVEVRIGYLDGAPVS